MASTPELEDLIARWFDGALGPEEEARLDALLAADPAAFARFKELLGIEGLLRAREADGDVLPGRVLESLRQESSRRRFTDRVMDSIERRTSTSRRLAWLSAAAAILLAVIAAVVLRPQRPAAPPPQEARAENPPPPPPPPLDPPAPAPAPAPEPPPAAPAPPPPPPASGTKAPAPFVPPPPPPSDTKAPAPFVPPAPAPPAPTVVEEIRALAVLRGVSGRVSAVSGEARRPVADGAPLRAGEGLDVGPDSAASLEFDDGARVDLADDTEIRELGEREGGRKPRGRRMAILKGRLSATVPKQPADQPMSFATAQAEARVLGTSLRLTVEPGPKGRTALEVAEGKVRFVRTRDGKWIDVGPGLLATAGPDGDFAPRPALAEEIALPAREARLAGADWRLVADPRASGGAALEALKTSSKPTDHVETRTAWAAFEFWARGDVDYTLWVRAHSLGTGDPWTRDLLVVHPLDAKITPSSPFFGTAPTSGFVFTGLGAASQYAWLSGGATEAKELQVTPLRVRFHRTGFQTLRLLVGHPGIRVDLAWLSVSQGTRPAARQMPVER